MAQAEKRPPGKRTGSDAKTITKHDDATQMSRRGARATKEAAERRRPSVLDDGRKAPSKPPKTESETVARSPLNGQPVPKGKPFEKGDERAVNAGISSGAARRKKRTLREIIETWMDTVIGTEEDGTPVTGAERMIQVAVTEALNGNARFWELLRDTSGQKPVDRVMMTEVEPEVIDEVERIARMAAQEAEHDAE